MFVFDSVVIALVLCLVVFVAATQFRKLLDHTSGITIEERINAWDVFIKGVTLLAGGPAIAFGYYQYMDHRESDSLSESRKSAQMLRESNIRLYTEAKTHAEAQRVFLNEASDLVAMLASIDSYEELQSPPGLIAQERFENLYHGQLVLYETKPVSNAMIDFRDALIKWRRTKQKPRKLAENERTRGPKEDLELNNYNSDFMRQLSLNLSYACRSELQLSKEPAVSN